jgi:hypothetical protein
MGRERGNCRKTVQTGDDSSRKPETIFADLLSIVEAMLTEGANLNH